MDYVPTRKNMNENPNRIRSRKELKASYLVAKLSEVGNLTRCPSCSSVFVKTRQDQAFCRHLSGTVCKDWYWNHVTPTKINNWSRIKSKGISLERMSEFYGRKYI